MSANVLRLKPLQYAHVLDLRTNITDLWTGPKTMILQDNQSLVYGPAKFIIIPPGCYCVVENPVKLPVETGKQANLIIGYDETRFHQDPFPLYAGEVLKPLSKKSVDVGKGLENQEYKNCVARLPIIAPGHALKLQALADFTEDGGTERVSGDEWLIEGPHTYYPRSEVKIVEKVAPIVIKHGAALHLRARQDLVDRAGVHRVTGEEWLVRTEGAYLLGAYEESVGPNVGETLTLEMALHMKAGRTLVDGMGRKRLAGEQWLVTADETTSYISEVGEELLSVVKRTVLNSQQFCVVLDPIGSDGKNQLGKRELRAGLQSFFLNPGEHLDKGIQNIYVLQDDSALILSAKDEFLDTTNPKAPVKRIPGDVWMIFGPQFYTPSVEVEVKDIRKTISLDKNEGIYIQDQKSGCVRTEMGPQSYMLKETEALWNKELSPLVENMLVHGGCAGEGDIRKLAYFESSVDPVIAAGKRDKTRIVTYRVPPNTAVQVFDHKKQEARVIFGPNLVILEPSEDFNVLSLSAGKPKKSNALHSLAIMLGPDFITDIIEVETLDHARLRIKYAANNRFEYVKGDETSEKILFAVPDFIGFACRNIASRIRGRVARTSFDEFHRYSTRVVKEAVFGLTADNELKSQLKFDENNLVITNIDVQSIEPVDTQMRDSLLKSVQLAIEISTQSIERAAAHEAAHNEQTAQGKLEINKLVNEKAAEDARRHLYELRAITAAVESSGQATAEAEAQAEKTLIEGKSAIEASRLKAEAEEIEEGSKLKALEQERRAEIEFTRSVNELEVAKAKRLAEIESVKAKSMVAAIGSDTICNIAMAEPQAKVHMLSLLGVRSTIITDGKTPLNLYQGPGGMIQPM